MIRKLENTEIDQIMNIWKESTIKAHNFISKKYWESNYDTVRDVYIPMAYTFIYEDNSRIKGFISIINNEFIGALFVDINEQSNGIGKMLLEYVMNKYKSLNLAVYVDNKQAIGFYISRGFKIIKEQINEDSGFKEYIMEKTL